MAPRAPALSPDDRRTTLIEATLPLLYHHGRSVTTRLIAEAAGVAEGTIFRVFATKDELIDATLVHAFQPGPFVSLLDQVDRDLGLRDRLIEVTALMQDRFMASFGLIRALGLLAPPESIKGDQEAREAWRSEIVGAITTLVEPDSDLLRVPAAELVRVLRLLTFAGSHADITDGRLMTPAEIVDTVLVGLLAGPQTNQGATSRCLPV